MASSDDTSDQYAQLRRAIKHQLQQLGVGQEVHSLLLELSQRPGAANLTPTSVLELLEGKGLVKQLANNLGPPNKALTSLLAVSEQLAEEPAPLPSGAKQLLHVKVLAARGFVEYVARQPLPGELLALHGELCGQRFQSAPAAAAAEPNLAVEAYIELPAANSTMDGPSSSSSEGKDTVTHTGALAGSATAAAQAAASLPASLGIPEALHLLTVRQPLHLSVVQMLPPALDGTSSDEPSVLRRVVVALGAAEWRTVLVRKRAVTISVQLSTGPAGLASGLPSVPAGMLVLQLSLVPPLARACLDEPLLASQQRMESSRDSEAMAAFLARARTWWAEYVALRADFKARPVKVLARSEDGSQYPCCTFVAPLQLGRQLSTPRHAARFVSLLHRREEVEAAGSAAAGVSTFLAAGGAALGVVDGATGCWCSLHTVLTSKSASHEEAALLLCGLLLGFGLDAWVVLGRLRTGVGHTWVLTRGPLATPCFWEPATGVRYSLEDGAACPFLSVGCAFNHQRVCANAHHDDALATTSFLFEDPGLWHTLEVPRSEVPGPTWVPQLLRPCAVDASAVEVHLERDVMSALARHRAQALGAASTAWDLSLGHMLMPALEAYEHEAVSGEVAPGNAEFQQGIKRAVPLGWLFKGFPLNQRHLGAKEAASALLQEPQVQDILSTRTYGCNFAFRARVFTYPEGLVSVWMMVAVKFRGPVGGPP